MTEHQIAVGQPTPGPVSAAQRWWARLAYLAALAAVVILLAAGLKSIAILAVGLGGLGVMLAAIWWFLGQRGIRRWLAAALAIAAPVGVIAFYLSRDLLVYVVLFGLFSAIAVAAARAALASTSTVTWMPEQEAPPPARPFLIMNPRSGGGKVGKFELDAKAAAMGAKVALLDGPGQVDVAELARSAAAEGADLLGVAGGDGTQALVAGIAADQGLPFLVLSAGTRNHFAMDLGLDREHPDAGLDALADGVEVVLDLGVIGGRTFVNNASFGAYAAVVESPAYRDAKVGTALRLLPDVLSGQDGARLTVTVDGTVTLDAPKALLISNNPYEGNGLGGLARRARLDSGLLGVVAITVDSARDATALLSRRREGALRVLTAREVVIDADVAMIPVGIDGETVLMPTPVRCTIRPHAVRVRLPRIRPGVPLPRPPVDRALLRRQALTVTRLAR